MQDTIAAYALEAITRRVFPGCVVGVTKKGTREVAFCGRHTYDPKTPEVTPDSLYDCASITKSVPTAMLALQLIDEGKLSLDDQLTQYIPEFRTSHRNEVRIRHLLTYTLGNTVPLSSLKEKTPDEILNAVYTDDGNEPGTVFSYSNAPALLLGVVIERILAASLQGAARERIFKPLGMSATAFMPHGAVPTEEDVQDVVHDESARVFSRAGRAVGHSGLFSTVPDLLKFCEHLLKNPDERLCTNQIAHLGNSTALGWELDQPWMGGKRSPKTFGKTGFTGTSIVCDFDRETAIVILSNRTYPKATADRTAINTFRCEISDIVFRS